MKFHFGESSPIGKEGENKLEERKKKILQAIIDEYIISPRIYRKKNDIHPALTVFLLSFGATIGGVWGVVLAIPIYLLIRTIVFFFKDDMKRGIHSLKDVL